MYKNKKFNLSNFYLLLKNIFSGHLLLILLYNIKNNNIIIIAYYLYNYHKKIFIVRVIFQLFYRIYQ